MLPILLGYYTTSGAVIMSPFFFGIAHFHHMIERIRRGQDIQTAFFISSFQFAYTTIFGMYSALLFVRTGHLASCVVVHGFCNFMGFPDLVELVHQEPKKRLIGMLKALTQQFVL
jgi:prenyl protein peptidase